MRRHTLAAAALLHALFFGMGGHNILGAMHQMRAPSPSPEPRLLGTRRGKGKKTSQKKCGAAHAKRLARKRRNIAKRPRCAA